jgi:hypothetical protein
MEPEDRRLAESVLRATAAVDWTLQQILRYVDAGLDIGVTLLVNGIWIEGHLVRIESWADKLDADLDSGFVNLATTTSQLTGVITDPAALPTSTMTPGDVELARKITRDAGFRSRVDDVRANRASVRERAEAHDPSEPPPEDLADDVYAMHEPIDIITLRDAVIRGPAPAFNRQEAFLRISVRHIAAWHLGRSTEYVDSVAQRGME